MCVDVSLFIVFALQAQAQGSIHITQLLLYLASQKAPGVLTVSDIFILYVYFVFMFMYT
jgi:hypothetical protein